MKTLKKRCDDLWAECIKARAGYVSELSGKEGRQIGGPSILHAHHMFGKSSYRLRYELRNGIALTAGEHTFGVHHQGRREAVEERIRLKRGEDWEYCSGLSKHPGKTDLKMVLIFLQNELRKVKQ